MENNFSAGTAPAVFTTITSVYFCIRRFYRSAMFAFQLLQSHDFSAIGS